MAVASGYLIAEQLGTNRTAFKTIEQQWFEGPHPEKSEDITASTQALNGTWQTRLDSER